MALALRLTLNLLSAAFGAGGSSVTNGILLEDNTSFLLLEDDVSILLLEAA